MRILKRYLGKNITVRWVITEDSSEPMRGIGFELLEVSLRFGTHLFPNARRVIAVGNLKVGQRKVEKIAETYQIECYRIKDRLTIPRVIDETDVSHGFWKYMPLRTNRSGFDITIENELLLWDIPKEMITWFYGGGILAIGGYHHPYRDIGIYQNRVDRIDQGLGLNTGLIGFGIGCNSLPLSLDTLEAVTSSGDEKGWMSYNYAAFQGAKKLIPDAKIPIHSYVPEQINIDDYSGIHFLDHNRGLSRTYTTIEPQIMERLDYYDYLTGKT